MSTPIGDPLGPGGGLGNLLYPELGAGDEASVLNQGYPHNGHVDATLYKRFPDGQIYPIDKVHLDQKTLDEIGWIWEVTTEYAVLQKRSPEVGSMCLSDALGRKARLF